MLDNGVGVYNFNNVFFFVEKDENLQYDLIEDGSFSSEILRFLVEE